MDPAYRTIQRSLFDLNIHTELWRPNGRWFAIKVYYSPASDPPAFFSVLHTRRGWFLSAGTNYLIPNEDDVVDLCGALVAGPSSLKSVVDKFRLQKQVTWFRDESAAEADLWQAVGWRKQSDSENESAWKSVNRHLMFPGDEVSLARPFATWDLSVIYDFDWNGHDQASIRLNEAGLLSFRQCLAADEELIALNWNHSGYSLASNASLQTGDTELWPISIFSDGDYHAFVSGDLRCGILSQPDGKLTVFGGRLPEVMALQLANANFIKSLNDGRAVEP